MFELDAPPLIQLVLEGVFWLSAGVIAYAYFGYPLAIYGCSRLFGLRRSPSLVNDEALPSVSILIAAHDEEQVIGQRLENALAVDYPPERMEIVIASDGSRDRTGEIVRHYEARHPGRVRLVNYHERRGKASVLNATLPSMRGEIVVLSDANTMFDRSAVRNLACWFADPRVGVVCGKLILVDSRSRQNVESMYWRYENFLKRHEARLDALLGCNGAIYAIRRVDYVPIEGATILDDLVIPLLSKLKTRRQIVYDAQAIASEELPAGADAEFRRRSRIGAGGFQSLTRLWRLALPIHGWMSFAFVSHKVLRWLCPALLAAALVTNGLLAGEPVFRSLLFVQLALYSAALLGMIVPGNGHLVRLLRLAAMFMSLNLALGVGFWKWLAGQQQGTWQRTAR